jgi:two-component system sensor histidine kinase BarA
MKTTGGNTGHPYHYYLTAVVVLAVILLIGGITITGCLVAENELLSDIALINSNTEAVCSDSLAILDDSLELYDQSWNQRLEAAFEPFIAEYERCEGNPGEINLGQLKASLGGMMDLYIIDSGGVVEYSTQPSDIGLDFSQYPKFYEYITGIREGDSFSPDRIVKEIATGIERKYAYMPTPDHAYLLELGVVPGALQEYSDKKYYEDLTLRLEGMNPYLEGVRFFDVMGEPLSAAGYNSDPEFSRFLREEVIGSTTPLEVGTPGDDTWKRYVMVDLYDEHYASDRSIVVEFTYSNALVAVKLNTLLMQYLFIGIAAILIGLGILYFVTAHMTRPVRRIVQDVNEIAGGNLDHTIRDTRELEFRSLTRSINSMVGRLKEYIQRIEESEDALRIYNENLEKEIASRTAELKGANEEANLYLDIMVHDINNANTSALSSLELMEEDIIPSQYHWLDVARQSVRKSIEIIKNVEVIRRLYDRESSLSQVDLNSVILSEIRLFPGVDIRFNGSDRQVLADDLLNAVFSNIFGNSEKYIDKDGWIEVRVEDTRDDEVLISIEDTGPGVPDAEKELIFNRFAKGLKKKSGKGLGLFIVASLIQRYGGKIWAEDRVCGYPEQGLALHFTLKKP